jgi:hypothetical protein
MAQASLWCPAILFFGVVEKRHWQIMAPLSESRNTGSRACAGGYAARSATVFFSLSASAADAACAVQETNRAPRSRYYRDVTVTGLVLVLVVLYSRPSRWAVRVHPIQLHTPHVQRCARHCAPRSATNSSEIQFFWRGDGNEHAAKKRSVCLYAPGTGIMTTARRHCGQEATLAASGACPKKPQLHRYSV